VGLVNEISEEDPPLGGATVTSRPIALQELAAVAVKGTKIVTPVDIT
jgi:hypothetical protein